MQLHLDFMILLKSQCVCIYIAFMDMPSDMTVDTWIRLVRTQKSALEKVEEALKQAGLPPLAWYDVLLELERAGPDGIRPFALREALLLPQYGVSRLIDRIEKAGHLEKRHCAEDGRGQLLAITQQGRRLRAAMWPVYGAAIERTVGARLTPGEARILVRLLGKLLPED